MLTRLPNKLKQVASSYRSLPPLLCLLPPSPSSLVIVRTALIRSSQLKPKQSSGLPKSHPSVIKLDKDIQEGRVKNVRSPRIVELLKDSAIKKHDAPTLFTIAKKAGCLDARVYASLVDKLCEDEDNVADDAVLKMSEILSNLREDKQVKVDVDLILSLRVAFRIMLKKELGDEAHDLLLLIVTPAECPLLRPQVNQAFNEVLEVYGKLKKWEKILQMLDYRLPNWTPSTSNYTIVMKHFLDDIKATEAIVEHMKTHKMNFSTLAYCNMIEAYGRAGQMNKAEEIFPHVRSLVSTPYISMIRHYGRLKNLPKVDE